MEYKEMPKIDMFILDEFYKISQKRDDERYEVLNNACNKMLNKHKARFYFLGPHIDNISQEFIDKYNAAAAAGNEELTKEIQKIIEKFDKYGEDLLKNAQRHDKLQSEIEETINTLEELEDAIEDIRIEAFKAHQEAQDDLKDLKEDAAELAAIFRDFNDDGFLTD